MHEQCLYEFEAEIGVIRDEHDDECFCQKHHPRKEEELSSDDEDADDNKASSQSIAPVMPPPPSLPPLPIVNDTKCDWEGSKPGCKLPSVPTMKCQRESCMRQTHHLCAIEWETSMGIDESTISTYCRYHHLKYPTMNQLTLLPTTTAMITSPSPSFGNNDSDDDNLMINDNPPLPLLADNIGGVSEGNEENDIADDDSSICSCDNGDSGDDGSEAEIHDAGTQFETMENTIDDIYGVDFQPGLPGAPKGWLPPGPPDGWVYVPPAGSPKEEEVDNPANWNLYSFAPRINASTKKYEGHFTPAGAKVVPINKNGIRKVGDWTFHYNGWIGDEFDKNTFVRDDAVYGNLKPESRRGCLDVDILKKHGLDATRMHNGDPLFFYQMLFPICDPKRSSVDNDGRMPYFSVASICTNVYAVASGAGSGIGHEWVVVTAPELVKWTACPIRNGALDGQSSTLPARWNQEDPRYDLHMAKNMSASRFKMIKRFFKLNNNLIETKKKGDDGYDPCAKYDLIYKVLIHNMNYVTRHADLDATIDESTWGFGGFAGDCGRRLINKPVSRGKLGTISFEYSFYVRICC